MCAAYRAVKAAESDIQVKVAHKRESTPYAPGMGQNGTKPKVHRGYQNWYNDVSWHEERPFDVRRSEAPLEPLVPGLARIVQYRRRRANALYGF